MNKKPELEENGEERSEANPAQSSWPPPIVPDCEDPAIVKPARSFIEKVKTESKILGWFAVAGMLYGFLVALLTFGTALFPDPSDPTFGESLSLSIIAAIIWALLIGLPLGCIVGFVFGQLRRTSEAWTLVGFALGGGISLLFYYFQVILGGTPISTRLIVICAIPAVLSTTLSEALRRDYIAVRQRMPMIAKLKQSDVKYSA